MPCWAADDAKSNFRFNNTASILKKVESEMDGKYRRCWLVEEKPMQVSGHTCLTREICCEEGAHLPQKVNSREHLTPRT
jgi:hypothetical protein